jgi:alginate O-acetyltransferase complex protein AlgI
MLFNSFSFLIFFAIVSVLYYVLPYRLRWIMLLIASCYFYMAFIPAYILILFYLIAIDFIAGIFIEKSQGKKRRAWLTASVIANVGTLFFFKYFNFFNANVARVAALIHWNYSPLALSIILPLGLSFHTFQSLAYVIEVYRGKYPAERHLGIYALYVMFFPQLVAGPIERPQELLPQLHAHHEFREDGVVEGLRVMLWGFFKKIVVADTIGVVVDTVYGNLHTSPGPVLALAAVAFAIQLYADFSGYSDIARGAAKVLGINLVNNFKTPYFSRSIAEFWRRWHISLSNWFRDYFYQPIALAFARGFRKAGLYLALFITFIVIGLWHGAGWTYIFFGAIFGFYIVFGMITKPFRERIARAIGLAKFPKIYAAWQMLVTFGLVCVGLVFFRSTSLHDALYFVSELVRGWGAVFHPSFLKNSILHPMLPGLSELHTLLIIAASIVVIVGEQLNHRYHIIAWLGAHPRALRWAAYYVLILWILAFGHYQARTFIYFQF